MENNIDKKPRVGLGVIVINNKNQILLGQRKGSHGENTWAPPGGHLEFGESFEQCAIREVLEETSLKISNPKFLGITNDYFTEEVKHYVSIFMVANYYPDQVIKNCEPDKVEIWRWFDLNNLPRSLFLPLKHIVEQKGYGNVFSKICVLE